MMALRREREIEFSQPVRQIVLMVLSVAAAVAVGAFLYEPIAAVFEANVYLNGLIVGVFVLGVLFCFRQVYGLSRAVSWIEGFAVDRPGHEFARAPRLLTSLANLLKDGRARSSISTSSARVILDSIATRLDDSRDITRYLGNLLIFLGLLGTFWGLSITVPAVVDTIRNLAPTPDQDGATVFDRLMSGLEDQLGGMGTAFASSLLGLAGSLVIGLLDLFSGHAQNRFYRELEEWLSTITRLGYAAEEGGAGVGATLVEQNAMQIERLAALLDANATRRADFEDRIAELTESVSRLAGHLREAQEREATRSEEGFRGQIALLQRIGDQLERVVRAQAEPAEADAEVRGRLRSIDRHLLRALEETASGRQDAVAEIRGEIQDLGRAIGALAERSGRDRARGG